MNRTRGLTLIEVLIAIFIMGMMTALTWQGMQGLVESKNKSLERIEIARELGSCLQQWNADLSKIVDARAVSPLQFDGNTMSMTKWTELGIQTITWRMESGKLFRRASEPALNQENIAELHRLGTPIQSTPNGWLPILSEVESWHIYVWRGNSWSNPQSTIESQTNDPDRKSELPEAIRLVVKFKQTPNTAQRQLTSDHVVYGSNL